MSISGVAQRNLRSDFQYVFGRFRSVRVTYSGVRRVLEAPKRALQRRDTPHDPGSTLFPSADVPRIVQAIREEAVFVGLNLPVRTVAEIQAFALSEPLHAIYDPDGPTFHYSDVVNGTAADGRPMPVGGIREPPRCP